MIKERTYEPIPAFNDHGSTCKGHGNFMLDCTYEKKEDREILIKALDSSINSLKFDIKKESKLKK